MPPRLIHLVRHAEGHHNVNWQHHLRDPILTDLGHTQCSTLAAGFPYHSRITKIICSPLKRTIQTTLESFHPTISRLSASDPQWKIRTDPYFQETGEWECDLGSTLPELKAFLKQFPEEETPEIAKGYKYASLLDFSTVESDCPEWPAKEGKFSAETVKKRSEKARHYLYDNYNEDEEIIVVTHGGFLHYITEDWESYDELMGTGWGNTDWRTYTIREVDGVVQMVETEECLKRRKAEPKKSGDETEKREVEAGGHHAKE
ncbi:hypothetical protein ABW20_dc0102298 [Dactylellina cionopaga]|nr:hypothetical protein ABW20_dc0102298 [Dactylellina cionopaga]